MASGCASQFSSRPTLTTALYPPSGRCQVLPETIFFTGLSPFTCMSKSRISFRMCASKTRCRCGAAIVRWPGAALGICFDDEAAEVRNALVNCVGGCFPPGAHIWIERIECLQSSDCHWAAQIH